jgi:hypothetical protein
VIDKVGFNAAPTGFYAGTKLSIPATFPTGQFAWVRNFSNGAPVNTNDNASDFSYVSTSDNDSAHGSPLLGAPGPGNLVSPIVHNDVLQSSLLDPSAAQDASPNRIYTAGSPGTLIVNRVFTNCSGQTPTPGTPCANVPAGTTPKTVTRLRFRITGLTTVNSPGAGSTQAVLKADTSTGEAGLAPAACSGTTDVLGLPLDSPSVSGSGGLNSTWTATAELPPGGLAPGECLNVEFEFDVTQPGHFGFAYNAEDDLVAAPPASAGLGGSSSGGGGSTQGGPPSSPGGSPAAPGGSPAGTAGSPPPKACAGAARVPLSLLGPPIPDLVTGILGRSSSSARPRAITTGGCGTPAVKPRPKGSVAAHPGRVRAGHRVRVAGTIGPRCVAGAKVRVISRAFAPGRAVRVALVHARRAGLFSIWLRVPRSRKAGTYLVNATCGGRQFASAKLKVTR